MNQNLLDSIVIGLQEEVSDYEYLEMRDDYEKIRREGDDDATFLRVEFDKEGRPVHSKTSIQDKVDSLYESVMEVDDVRGVKRIYGTVITFEIFTE